ncbi:MAG: hypothetical protein RLZZ436_797 [Planctomycetota bacterium]
MQYEISAGGDTAAFPECRGRSQNQIAFIQRDSDRDGGHSGSAETQCELPGVIGAGGKRIAKLCPQHNGVEFVEAIRASGEHFEEQVEF